jgi:hypothetical protein
VSQNRTRGFLGEKGQSLVEVALIVPIMTVLVCYAVDLGFYIMAATSLTSAARNAIEYSIQGTASTSQSAEPSASAISNLLILSIGLPGALASTVSVQVCANPIGLNILINAPQCATPVNGAGAISLNPDLDPESPTFQLNRVDVVYNFTPPIPIPTSILPSTTMRRTVEMRAIQ